MIPEDLNVKSNITFLYYRDLEAAAEFYSQVMGFRLVFDVEWAKLYAIHGGAFLGLVDSGRGQHEAKDDNALLITLAVSDVQPWYDYLVDQGVRDLTEPKTIDEIQIQTLFFKDPGGYTLEIQQFLDPDVARRFHQID